MLSGRRRTSTHTKQVSQVRARLSQRTLEVAFGVVLVAGAVAVAGGALAAPVAAHGPAPQERGRCGGTATYTVEPGESWFRIAQAVGVKMGLLFEANTAKATSPIHPGDVVCLPKGTTAPVGNGVVEADPPERGMQALPAQGPCWYGDTWHVPRGAGRRHEGVDLIAEAGNYVYAVEDGTLSKRAWWQPGLLAGNAWWLTSSDGSGTYYFYGHLSDFAPGLGVGSSVKAGQIIGFIGETGSAATPHLHFEIHPDGGGAVNPYPAVRVLGGCKKGAGYEQPGGWVPAD